MISIKNIQKLFIKLKTTLFLNILNEKYNNYFKISKKSLQKSIRQLEVKECNFFKQTYNTSFNIFN